MEQFKKSSTKLTADTHTQLENIVQHLAAKNTDIFPEETKNCAKRVTCNTILLLTFTLVFSFESCLNAFYIYMRY